LTRFADLAKEGDVSAEYVALLTTTAAIFDKICHTIACVRHRRRAAANNTGKAKYIKSASNVVPNRQRHLGASDDEIGHIRDIYTISRAVELAVAFDDDRDRPSLRRSKGVQRRRTLNGNPS
jgi:hypothetical protein